MADLEGKLALSLVGGSLFRLEARPSTADHWPFGTDLGTGDMLFRPHPQATNGDIEYFDRAGWHVARRISGPPMSAAEVVQAAPETYHSDCAAATLHFVATNDALEVIMTGEFGVGHYPAASVGPDVVRFWAPGLSSGMLIRLERESGRVERVIVSTTRTRATVFQRGTRFT